MLVSLHVEKENEVTKRKIMDVGKGRSIVILEQKGKGVEEGQELINDDEIWMTSSSNGKQLWHQMEKI